jgi:hypothetical protein
MKITAMRTVALEFPYMCQFGAPYPGTRLGAVAVFLDTKDGITGESVLIAFNNKRISVLREMVHSLEALTVGPSTSVRRASR